VRAPPGQIFAPPFPPRLPWVNVATLRMDQQLGHPLLIEFWDFCRPNSLRTLPYVRAWHERYRDAGLRVVGVHCPGFAPSRDPDAVRRAVARLGITHPVLIDSELVLWKEYGNEGWPARYLWNAEGTLSHYHYGEGAYADTELAIAELLGLEVQPLAPLRPEDVPGAALVAQTEDQAGAYSGPYEAGGVWAVLEGRGTLRCNDHVVTVTDSGAHCLIEHPRHTRGDLVLAVDPSVTCHATCFTPGVAAAPAASGASWAAE